MKKSDIIEAIFENNPEYYKQDVEKIVNEVFELIKLGLVNDGKVMINNFGTFEIVEQNAYLGVNPYTGERQMFEGGNRVRFISSKALKDKVNAK